MFDIFETSICRKSNDLCTHVSQLVSAIPQRLPHLVKGLGIMSFDR